jgi:nucleotide-binding universal stress UspA family protein
MFKRILVTLDGSDLSERALQPAFELAEKFEAQVTLLRVIAVDAMVVASVAGAGPQYLQLVDMHEARERADSEAYLRAIQAQWRATGVAVATRVAVGAAPEMIVQVAAQCDAELIVMSTHGRSGLNRFLYGSVAEAVLRGTRLPLMLIPVK